MKWNRVLVLAPHTDDGEFGAGGTIAKYIEKGVEFYYVAFSPAKKSLPAGLPKNITEQEVKKATAVLGIPSENLILYNFEVRDFPELRQPILEEMVKLRRGISPDVVILPSPDDTHQDHKVIAEEGFRAFKRSTMLGYEIPWNNLVFRTEAFVQLSVEHVERKVEALRCYTSQEWRGQTTNDFLWNLASIRGMQIGSQFAEVFEVIRWIMK
jgi:LmbE family N-acetylglucosaminyl deacetylase